MTVTQGTIKKIEFENGSMEISTEESGLKSTGNIVDDQVSELTVFEETLTEEGLAIIKKEADELPVIAKTNQEYDLVYEFNTRLKRVSVAARKKEKALQKDLKHHFNEAKAKIANDLSFVIDIITPIITKTIESRDYLECWKLALKENKARDEAVKQRLEFERQEKIRAEQEAREKYENDWILAHHENELFDEKIKHAAEAERIRLEQENLERERFEFDCEKTRLNFDDAWEEAHPEIMVVGSHDDIKEAVTVLKGVSVPLTTASESTETDNFQQIMTEKVDEPEIVSDIDWLIPIQLEASSFCNKLGKLIEIGLQDKSNETYIYNFFLVLKKFLSDFPNTDI